MQGFYFYFLNLVIDKGIHASTYSLYLWTNAINANKNVELKQVERSIIQTYTAQLDGKYQTATSPTIAQWLCMCSGSAHVLFDIRLQNFGQGMNPGCSLTFSF